MFRRLPAYTIYLIIQGSFWLFFAMMSTLSAVYRVQSAGLNPFQLILVGTVLEATVFVFEIPTGIVADVYSRRLSVIVGYLLIGFGFMLEGAFPIFAPILLAQVIWGVGATFTSGAEEAWLADEVGEKNLAHIYLRGSQVAQAGTLIGILVSVALGRIALNIPIFLGGLCIVGLGLFLALFMPENEFKPAPSEKRNTFKKMGQTFQKGIQTVRGRPILITMMAIALIYGLSSEGLDRLWEAHFLANFTFPTTILLDTVAWFGIINIVQMLLVIGATELIRRYVKVEDQLVAIRALLLINILVIAGLVAFGLAQSFAVALLSIWTVQVMRGSGAPLYSAWLNKGLKSDIRATVLSMRGQLDAFGQIMGGPIIGLVATSFGLRAAMIGVALMLTPVVLLYGRALRLVKDKKDRDPAALGEVP